MNSTFRSALGTIALSASLFFALPSPALALGIPFGGIVTFIRPCLGASFVVATIVQPPPRPPIEVAVAASPFPYYTISHVGQYIVGNLSNPTFCLTSPHSGFTVPFSAFFGTSL